VHTGNVIYEPKGLVNCTTPPRKTRRPRTEGTKVERLLSLENYTESVNLGTHPIRSTYEVKSCRYRKQRKKVERVQSLELREKS